MTPWLTPHSTELGSIIGTSFILIKVFGVLKLSMFLNLSKLSSMGALGGGGGGQQASCSVAKQAVEFSQVLASKALLDCMQKMDHPTPQ